MPDLFDMPGSSDQVKEYGPPASWNGKTAPMKRLSKLDEPFDDDEIISVALPAPTTATIAEDETTECILTGAFLRKILTIPDFPSPLPKPSKDLYEVREAAAGHGLGLFATADIEIGETVVCERPLMLGPDSSWFFHQSFPDEYKRYEPEERAQITAYEWEKYVAAAVAHMSDDRRKKYLALTNSHTRDGTGPRNGIQMTNAHNAIPAPVIVRGSGQAWYMATGEIISRANHSCSPNVRFHFYRSSFGMALRALRLIRAGEEITVNYDTGGLSPAEERQRLLAPYDFRCTCQACLNPDKSDPIRIALGNAPQPDTNGSVDPKLAARVCSMIEGEGLQCIPVYPLYLLAASVGYAKAGKPNKAKRYRDMYDKASFALVGYHRMDDPRALIDPLPFL